MDNNFRISINYDIISLIFRIFMFKKLNKQQKIALITGANSSISKAVAKHLANEGYYLILTSKNSSKLAKTEAELKQSTLALTTIDLNLADLASVKKFAEKLKLELPRLNLIVHIAGIYHTSKQRFFNIDLAKYTSSQIIENYNVTAISLAIIVKELHTIMPKYSKIITLTGTFESGAQGWLPYYAGKKALESLTIGLSQELKARKILVNCLSPSDTYTEAYKKFFPEYALLEKCLSADEIADEVLHLTSINSINGQILELKKM